jgi:hypothetical protein
MGLLGLAINGHARMGVSPNGPAPLDLTEFYRNRREMMVEERARAALRNAEYTLRDAKLGRPDLVRKLPKPRQESRDVLRSGLTPGSEGDRAFASIHRVNVIDDPANTPEVNDQIFRATNVAGPRCGSRMTPHAPTPLAESVELTEADLDWLAGRLRDVLVSFSGMTEEQVVQAISELDEDDASLLELAFGNASEEEIDEVLECVSEDLVAKEGMTRSPALSIALHAAKRAKVRVKADLAKATFRMQGI